MSRLPWLVAGLALASAAHGDTVIALSVQAQDMLTAMDAVPTQAEIAQTFPDPATALSSLVTVAGDTGDDVGIRIRTLHALGGYCAPPCADADPAHAALVSFITANEADQSGATLVMLRSAIEALGPERDANDLTVLVPLLAHPSRDIRAATAHALRDLCNAGAIPALRTQEGQETSAQVKLAIADALRVLSAPTSCE